MTRRQFLVTGSLAAASAALSRAVEPFVRNGKPRFQLSLAAYSFRDFFKDPAKMDFYKFIDLCADNNIPGAELTSYYFHKDVTDAELLKVRRHAFLRGVSVSGTAVGNNFALPDGPELDKEKAYTKQWIDRAAVLGAPHIRVFAGGAKGIDEPTARRQVIKTLEELGAYAAGKGIWLGVENHGGIVATPEGLLEIIKAVNSPAVGINLDTGNFHGEDPYADLARCAPWAVNVQVKVEISRAKSKAEPADLKKIAALLREANYQGWVALEYESKPDPFTAVPQHLKELKEALG
ncbi:MAG TPA: sugar phosphate isomerase/epimerase family protein [Verrucomicrobiales bacterium]|jgi:sugar phosphate isomerase/epimerase|nr:sugar phosphate isomerase/epimerase family protein [Verrucomicrobiales bacterium]